MKWNPLNTWAGSYKDELLTVQKNFKGKTNQTVCGYLFQRASILSTSPKLCAKIQSVSISPISMQNQKNVEYQSFFAAKNGADLSVKLLAEQVDNNYIQLDSNAPRQTVTSRPSTIVSSPALLQWAEKHNLQAIQDCGIQQAQVSQRPKATYFTQQYSSNSYQVYPYQSNTLEPVNPPPYQANPLPQFNPLPSRPIHYFNQHQAGRLPYQQNGSSPLDYLYTPAKSKVDYEKKCHHQRVINILMRLFPEVSAEFVLIVFQQAAFDEMLAAERLLAMKEAMLFREDGD